MASILGSATFDEGLLISGGFSVDFGVKAMMPSGRVQSELSIDIAQDSLVLIVAPQIYVHAGARLAGRRLMILRE